LRNSQITDFSLRFSIFILHDPLVGLSQVNHETMNVFVSGADGLLGSNTVRILLERGYEVHVLIQPGSPAYTLEDLPLHFHHGDILDLETLCALTKGMDAVIHCAASTRVWPTRCAKQWEINVQGTENIIEACLRNAVKRLVHVGTANSFASGSLQAPGTERNGYAAARYRLDYMDSKREAQEKVLEAVRTRNLPALVVNPTFMLGPYDAAPSSGAMLVGIVEGKVPCATHGGKNFIYVKDAATGVANALKLGRIGEAYILGNENLSIREFFGKVGTVLKVPVPTRTFPSFLVRAYGGMNTLLGRLFRFVPDLHYPIAVLSCEHHYYSAQKAVEELKLPQTPIELGIAECYEWLRDHHKIKAI
jgi:dihydroflavonol-4-reductase